MKGQEFDDGQKLDDNEKAIRDWIRKHPKKTENEVAKAMMEIGQCHRLTTLKRIPMLKERGIIEDIRAKPNSFSCLIVKDDNEFNKINEELSKLEKHIDELQIPKAKKRLELPDDEAIMLSLLLHLAMSKKFPLKDSELLEKKIIKLMLALYVKKVRSMRGIEAMAVFKNEQKASKS